MTVSGELLAELAVFGGAAGAVNGCFMLGRNVLNARKERHERLTAQERGALHEPILMHGEVLDNAEAAVRLQSDLLEDLASSLNRVRGELDRVRGELDRTQAENTDLRTRLGSADAEILRLSGLIAQLQAANAANAAPGTAEQQKGTVA